MNEKKPPRRFRCQFTVRTLLLLTAVIALWLGWITDRAARQRAAVRELDANNAELFFDDKMFDPPVFSFSLGRGLYNPVTGRNWSHRLEKDADGNWLCDGSYNGSEWDWLPRWVDKDYFRVLVGVNVDRENSGVATRDALKALGRVPTIKWLALDDADCVGDEEMKEIARLTKLERLFLARTAVTDAGLKCLSSVPNLRYLSLAGTKVTDAGLPNLECLKHLEMLELCDTAVSDSGIESLSALRSLKSLYVDGTKVTKAGVGRLRKDLPNCFVTLEWPGWARVTEDRNESEEGGGDGSQRDKQRGHF
jgi:hypothetical protein